MGAHGTLAKLPELWQNTMETHPGRRKRHPEQAPPEGGAQRQPFAVINLFMNLHFLQTSGE